MKTRILCLTAFLVLTAVTVHSQDRFPRPDFRTEYNIPSLEIPNAAESWIEYLDLSLLAVMLIIVTWASVYLRSRRAVVFCSIISLFYFGFIRQGCICPVGSIQNVFLVFADPGYAIPVFVVGFFLLPIIMTLFFGRTFCAGVCPLGAIQDIVHIKTLHLPGFLNKALSLLPYVYLGLAALFVFSGFGFLICKFDPFVEIFRFGSRLPLLIWGGVLLAVSTVIARPYCRFLCPYGALLGLVSRVSRRHITITPDKCINCRLCEKSCPVDAIIPAVDASKPVKSQKSKKRLVLSFCLLPVFILAGTGAGALLPGFFSLFHREVQIAGELQKAEIAESFIRSEETNLFAETGIPRETLIQDAKITMNTLTIGSPLFGSFLGLVAGLFIIGLSIPGKNTGYVPDKAACVSCARCVDYCPKEDERQKNILPNLFKKIFFRKKQDT